MVELKIIRKSPELYSRNFLNNLRTLEAIKLRSKTRISIWTKVTPPLSLFSMDRLNQDETSEDRSPIYPAERRRATLRRRRRLSKRQRPVNVHIYQDSRVVQVGSLSENHRFASKGVHLQDQRSDLARYTINTAKNLIRSEDDTSTRQDDDSDDPERDIRTGEQWKRDRGFFGERCRPSDNPASKLMAHSR